MLTSGSVTTPTHKRVLETVGIEDFRYADAAYHNHAVGATMRRRREPNWNYDSFNGVDSELPETVLDATENANCECALPGDLHRWQGDYAAG